MLWSGQVGEPRAARPSLLNADCLQARTGRLPSEWEGDCCYSLSQSHFNLFYLGMGDRKGKKKESFPTSLQKNIRKFPNSKWPGWVSAHCCPRRLSGMKGLLKAFGSVQLERALVVFQVQSLPLSIQMNAWHLTRWGLCSGFNLRSFRNTFPYAVKLATDSDSGFFLNCTFYDLSLGAS